MKHLLKILFVLFIGSGFRLSAEDLLKKAEQAYDSKKYKEAIETYEKLVKSGYKSWELFYNLGNAYYRDKQLGMAIYNYELARKLNPNDEDIRINLGIASAKTIDKIDSKENFFISAVKTNVLSSFSTTGWAWLSVGSALLFCLLVFIFVSAGRIFIKRLSFVFAFILLIGLFATYLLGLSALRSKYENKFAIIVAKEAKMRNEPTPGASSRNSLHEGTKIRVVENNGDWVLIKLDNGNEGWVKMEEIGII